MSTWLMPLEAKFYSIIKTKTEPIVKKTYPKAKYSTVDASNTPDNVFPSFYIHLLPATEIAEDLEGDTINGANVTIEIVVTTNVSKEVCQYLADLLMETTKKELIFRFNSLPIAVKSDSIYTATIRGNRRIGKQDII